MPDLERMRLDHVVRRPTPRGVIAPRPVTTTLRMTLLFGDGGPQDWWKTMWCLRSNGGRQLTSPGKYSHQQITWQSFNFLATEDIHWVG